MTKGNLVFADLRYEEEDSISISISHSTLICLATKG